MIIPLILGAFVIIAITGLVVLWGYLDGRISQSNRSELQDLTTRLEAAETELKIVKRRVEDLETIATSEV